MRGDIEFRLLGPWEVATGHGQVPVPAGRLRALVTLLALSAGEAVGMDVLAEQLWPEQLPNRARATLHTYVNRLRKLLGADLLRTDPAGGYVLAVAPDQVDVHRFRDLLRRADDCANPADPADPAVELQLLRDALALWRGRPFADLRLAWLERNVVPRLTEEWFAAIARRIDLELADGRPEQLIAELRGLTSRFPTREALWVRLITALHRAGRRAEALTTYDQVRALLSDELGIDPSEQLATLHRLVLAEHDTQTPPTRPSPRQLPHDIARFTGRQVELAGLSALLEPHLGPTIVTIDGPPGVGKTTLAVHWAHQVAGRCPDVQLYLNLRGYGPGDPVAPFAAAATLLHALGMPGRMVPSDPEQRFAALRGELAGRRALLLLDNAADVDQVWPLLPAATGLVIVTSRRRLTDLTGSAGQDGAHQLTLNRLPRHQSVELLAGAVGSARVAAEPAAAARLADLCDHLPLALAIVAERAHRAAALAEVVAALEQTRLDVLSSGEDDPHTDLRAALSWSYRALPPAAAALFCLLGLHPGNDIGLPAAAALAGVPVPAARALLDELVAAHLVEQRRDRYELHDLVRLYAGEVAADEVSTPDQRCAVRGMLDWYLHAAASADRAINPSRPHAFLAPYEPSAPPPRFASGDKARAWFEQEYECLRAVTAWAAANGWAGHAWRTAIALTTYFDSAVPWRHGLAFYEAAYLAARSTNEVLGEGYTLNSLGCIHHDRSNLTGAKAYWERSLERFRRLDDTRGEALLLGNLAVVHCDLGDAAAARTFSAQALELFERLGEPRGIAQNLDNLGAALAADGEYRLALECYLDAHDVNLAAGDTIPAAWNQHNMARAYTALGEWAKAIRAYRTAIGMHRAAGHRRWAAIRLAELGKVLDSAGHPGLARALWTTALATMREFAEPMAQEIQAVLTVMGESEQLTPA